MRYLEMGLAFAALGFVVANTALSLLTALYWRTVRPARQRAGWLFFLRMLPAAGSAVLVLGLVLPAYWIFEPRETAERASPAILGFGIVALVLVGLGLRRLIVSWLDTRRLERRWKTAAVENVRFGVPVLAYCVPSEMPLAALVGVVSPRLFVSDQFLDALSTGEQQAVMGHESGHLRSFDNLKRAAMRLAPDWLAFSSAGRQIERAWEIAAEEEADDHAVAGDRSRSLDLAGALLKASRLPPVRFSTVSNFCDESTIARRIARLLKDEPAVPGPTRSFAPTVVGFLALAGAAVVFAGPALRAAYTMTESAVRLLQ